MVQLVQWANEFNVVIIPFGGGTSVSKALECSKKESRMITSLDTSQMNNILWIDKNNWTACVESGKVGQDLEAELAKEGFCTGNMLLASFRYLFIFILFNFELGLQINV